MKKRDARLKVLERQTLTHMLLADKRRLHRLSDAELSTLMTAADPLGAEIYQLIMNATEEELRSVVL